MIAARTLGCNASIVVPRPTPELMQAKLLEVGATRVVVHGNNWSEADEYLRGEVIPADLNGVYVPPFDHEDVWAGNATLVSELARQIPAETRSTEEPTAIVCSVGGGGLFCGIMQGLDSLGWNTHVLAVETAGADSLGQSIQSGAHIKLPGITSQAVSLGATKVSARAWDYANTRKKQVHSIVVSDGEAAIACVRFADEQRCMVELACGASVAAIMEKDVVERSIGRELREDDTIVVVVCGGSIVTVDVLKEWQIKYGNGSG